MNLEKYLNNHYATHLQNTKEELINKLEDLDTKLFKKKPKHLIVKDHRTRIIWTPYTDLEDTMIQNEKSIDIF